MSALMKSGIRPVLISSFCGAKYDNVQHVRALSLSPADLKYELDFTLSRSVGSGSLFKFLRVALFLPLYPFYFIETKILNVYGESRWSWMPLSIITGLVMALKTKPSYIYSTGGPASAHIVASVISRLTRIPLMAELQDPLVGEDIGRNALSKWGLVYIERIIFNNADKVIFCTEAARDSAAIRHKSDKAVCIYPGSYLDMPLVTANKDQVFRFIYLGSLYQTRNLDRFMEALSLAFKERPELKDNLLLDVYGNMNEDIRQRINSFQYNVIKLHGLVPRADALHKAMESDVLLLVQNTDDRSSTTIPFKTYDYLLLGRKILGLIYKNPELESILASHGHLSVPAGSAQNIKESILMLHDEWRAGTLTANIKTSAITVEKAAAEMISVANTLAPGK